MHGLDFIRIRRGSQHPCSPHTTTGVIEIAGAGSDSRRAGPARPPSLKFDAELFHAGSRRAGQRLRLGPWSQRPPRQRPLGGMGAQGRRHGGSAGTPSPSPASARRQARSPPRARFSDGAGAGRAGRGRKADGRALRYSAGWYRQMNLTIPLDYNTRATDEMTPTAMTGPPDQRKSRHDQQGRGQTQIRRLEDGRN